MMLPLVALGVLGLGAAVIGWRALKSRRGPPMKPGKTSQGPLLGPSQFGDEEPVGSYLRDAWFAGLGDEVTWVPLTIGPFDLEVAAEPLSVRGVRVPTSMADAIQIVRSMQAMLPTEEIAEAMFRAAKRKVTPAPLPAGPAMSSWGYTREWNNRLGAIGKELAG